MNMKEVKGRHLFETFFQTAGERLRDLDGRVSFDAEQRMILHAVLLAIGRQGLAGGHEDVNVMPVAALSGRQFRDEVGQCSLLPGRTRGKSQCRDTEGMAEMGPTAFAQLMLLVPDIADLLNPSRSGHEQSGMTTPPATARREQRESRESARRG